MSSYVRRINIFIGPSLMDGPSCPVHATAISLSLHLSSRIIIIIVIKSVHVLRPFCIVFTRT